MSRWLCVLLVALWPAQAFGNWGLESGRATDSDAVALHIAEGRLAAAELRFRAAMTQTVAVERQKQLLGIAEDEAMGDAFVGRVSAWYRANILVPAAEIVSNPAASCSEARVGLQKFLGMDRQKQLLGTASNDETVFGDPLFRAIVAASVERCQQEASDECLVTGRFQAVYEEALGEERQAQLLGNSGQGKTWIGDALAQCAHYELKFTATSSSSSAYFSYNSVVAGTIKINYTPVTYPAGDPEAGLVNLTQAGEFSGKSEGDHNPFTITLHCNEKGAAVACGPQGQVLSPSTVIINAMDLVHPVFAADDHWLVTRSLTGKDTLKFIFLPATMMANYVSHGPPTATGYGMIAVFSDAFTAVHWPRGRASGAPQAETDNAQGQQASGVPLFTLTARGVYPDLFEQTVAGQANDLEGEPGHFTDSTVFTLIHRREPVTFPPRKDPLRLPAQPSSGTPGPTPSP